jgi:hypothetical protein
VTLASKLHPERFSAMSGKMAAIVGFILGESWTTPEIEALSVTSDGFVLTDAEFFGEAADLDRNLLNLLAAAEVTPVEREAFERHPRASRRLAACSVRAAAGNRPAYATGFSGCRPSWLNRRSASTQYTKQYTKLP